MTNPEVFDSNTVGAYADANEGAINMEVNATPTQDYNANAGTSVLKKAMDIQSQTAMILINSILQTPSAPAVNLPSHLGQNINTTA
jgi:hypothetical protein